MTVSVSKLVRILAHMLSHKLNNSHQFLILVTGPSSVVIGVNNGIDKCITTKLCYVFWIVLVALHQRVPIESSFDDDRHVPW